MSAAGKTETHAARAAARWGAGMPDWIEALAAAADAEMAKGGNLVRLGKQLGITGHQISGILGKTYPGKLDRFEAVVRGKLMSATVACPALQAEIARDACAEYQGRKFSAANPLLIRLRRCCPTCPNAFGGRK